MPPEFDLPDNVDVMVCIHPYGAGVPISQLFLAKEPHVYAANLDLMRRWSGKLGGDPARLSFWDYYLCSDAHTGMPTLFPHTLQSWLRDVRPISRGVFIDGGGSLPRDHLMLWLWMRLLWNPELDVEAAIADYCGGFYGRGGAPMADFHRLLAERYEGTVFGQRELRAESNGNLSQSIGQVFGRVYPPEVIDRLEESLLEASRLLGLPADPEWEIRANTVWTLRNRDGADRAYPVRLAVVDGRVSRPALRWPQGELTFAGELEPGDVLRVDPGPRATLERGGQRRDVLSEDRRGCADGSAADYARRPIRQPPAIAARPRAGGDGRVRCNIRTRSRHRTASSVVDAAVFRGVRNRRLRLLCVAGGSSALVHGPAVARRDSRTGRGPRPGAAAVRPVGTGVAPAPPAHLIQGGPRPGNADMNVGFVADLPTEVRVLQDADSLHVAFRCFQWLPPGAERDEVALTLSGTEDRPLLSIAVDPEGGRKGTDNPRVRTRTVQRFPPLRVVRVPPSRAVNVETGSDAAGRTRGAGHSLFAGHWTGTHTRIAGYEALLRFDVPTLAPNESILRATFHGYIEGQLNEVYVTGVGVSYSPEDDWDAESAALARKSALLEPDFVLSAGNNGGNAKVWFTSDVTRHVRRPGEGPGKPLTLDVTSYGGAGIRGLAVAGLERGERRRTCCWRSATWIWPLRRSGMFSSRFPRRRSGTCPSVNSARN